ncbi:hypothetical protein GO599_13075 [Sulfolobus islandicus]|uniref:Uncharacterized protein n=1 Tax=Saccharolobus islandicus (strain HVE10/4) TaxID=930943 RepID=F0NRB6_SACI0|nr:hypothetical protein [Sulfolobus islandicus]ADX82917.1 hypothetical protein SiH_1569 [Sulfolobus islandicus HVE10/4]WCM38288.1 hypothetical protein GO599_13075 [Sulfolobus islandicus]
MADKSAYELKLGESKARAILIIGYYQEDLGIGYATYEDIVALSGRSLSRARNIVNEMLKDKELSELIKVQKSGKSVKLMLTQKGLEVYHILKNSIEKENIKLDSRNLIPEFDKMIYKDTKMKTIKSNDITIKISIDYVVPNLKLPDLVNKIIRELNNGEQLLVGVAVELANAAQTYAVENKGNKNILSDLTRTIINVPIHISRTLDTGLPPHIYATPMDIEKIKEKISLFSVWTRGVSLNDIINYAKEGEAYGIVKLYSSPHNIKDSVVEPIAGTGIDAVSRLIKQGFNVITAIPSRAWLPALSIYADITSRFPTVDEILNGEGNLTKLLLQHIGRDRYERWAEHMLGIRSHMKTRNLKELGAIDIFKINGEKRVLSLTAARHVLRNADHKNTESMLSEAEKRISKVLEDGGDKAKIILEIIKKGFVSEQEMDEIIKNTIGASDLSQITKIKWDISKLGFIVPVGTGYYSAWTISPIFEQEDETLRGIYVWADKELSEISSNDLDMLQKLIVREEISLESEIGSNIKKIAKLSSLFSKLEAMGIVTFDKDNLTVKLTNKPRSKVIFQTALIEKMLGVRLASLEPQKGDENGMISSMIEVIKSD